MSDEELLFGLLANKNSRAILSLTSIKEISAIQLSLELDIPLATVYRKLKLLESVGVIRHVKTIINLQGNEEKFYRCAITEVTLHVNDGKLSLVLKKEDLTNSIIRMWTRLAHPDEKDAGQRRKS